MQNSISLPSQMVPSAAGSGKYLNNEEPGSYVDVVSDELLFRVPR